MWKKKKTVDLAVALATEERPTDAAEPEGAPMIEAPSPDEAPEKKEKAEAEGKTTQGPKMTVPPKKRVPLSAITRYSPEANRGLTQEQVDTRKSEGYVNRVRSKKRSVLSIIIANVFTPFNILYIIITIILVALHSYANLLYLLTIVSNFVIGLVQELRAKAMMDSLRLINAPSARVVRAGREVSVAIEELVLDDVVMLASGQTVPADAVLLSGSCEVNEALLTGESDPVKKTSGDRLYSGSFLSAGACCARIDAIGADTYIEKLSAEAKSVASPSSELLSTLNGIVHTMGILLIPLAVITLASNLGSFSQVLPALKSFGLYAVSGVPLTLEVSNALVNTMGAMILLIPAGLFLTTSTALFVSVIKLGRKNRTLVQQLYCIEMLARVDTLCLDKTGTITDGTMRVTGDLWLVDQAKWPYSLREIIGSMMSSFSDTNMTSEALIRYYKKNTVLKPLVKVPFSSARKLSAVTFAGAGTYVLGASEFVTPVLPKKIQEEIDKESARGERVIMIAFSENPIKGEVLPRNLKPVALIMIEDQIREKASEVIDYFKKNNVDVKVISGDNPATVSTIARRVGVRSADQYVNLHGLSDDEIREIAFDYTVFGRVTPSQKKLLVEIFQAHHRTVAMTGDGVNDIPALKQADCSIAMASGCEATRQISQLVLLDSDFTSMPAVVGEGRRVINNIQNTSVLFLNKTLMATLLTVFYFIISLTAIGIAYPFQSKCFNMIETLLIGIPAFAIALQPNKDLVSGNFVTNVFRKIVPSAFTVLLLNLALCLIKSFGWFGGVDVMTPDPALGANGLSLFVTIATFVMTFVCFLVLLDVCRPFDNIWKRLVAILAPLACIAFIVMSYCWGWFGDKFIRFAPLFGPSVGNYMPLMTTLFLIAFSYPLLTFTTWLFHRKVR